MTEDERHPKSGGNHADDERIREQDRDHANNRLATRRPVCTPEGHDDIEKPVHQQGVIEVFPERRRDNEAKHDS